MTPIDISLLVVAGFMAGFINTLAGNGSLVTLTILMEFIGLPPLVANGTNRVGIMFHSIIAAPTMAKRHSMAGSDYKRILLMLFLGGVVGGLISVYVSNDQFKFVYRILLVLLFFTLIIKPKKWLNTEAIKSVIPKWLSSIILFCIGIYGGFIQMGMGVILLACLVLLERIPIMTSNTIKLFSVLIYTPVVIALLIYHDLISWEHGLVLACGQILGGYLTSNYISKWQHAAKLAYITLIIMVVAAMIKIAFF